MSSNWNGCFKTTDGHSWTWILFTSPDMIIVQTERLIFRPHEEADLDAYCEMMADPEFRRLSGGKPLLREEAEKSLHSILIGQQDWLRPKPMGLFATIFKEEGRYIGRCGVYPHRSEENLMIPG